MIGDTAIQTSGDTRTLFAQTMGLVAETAAFFALGAYLGRDLSYGWGWIWFIAALLCLVGLNYARDSDPVAVGTLSTFGLLMGLAMAPTIAYYADVSPGILWQAAGATALFIAGFGMAGFATRRDLSAYARFAFWALIALIAYGIVLIFAQIPNGELIYAVLGLVIFAGLTMFDFQRLRTTSGIASAPQLAASIFLDILNVFTLFLSLFGGGSRRS
jgi:uncharacterized protein